MDACLSLSFCLPVCLSTRLAHLVGQIVRVAAEQGEPRLLGVRVGFRVRVSYQGQGKGQGQGQGWGSGVGFEQAEPGLLLGGQLGHLTNLLT